MLAASGGAARFALVEKTDPLDATAISRVRALQGRLAALGRSAGLSGVRFEVAGQTALIADSIGSVFADLGRVVIAIMVVTLILLALFLRSLLAPVYLLAASVLAVFATLGLAMLICRDVLGSGSMVYFVPFAAGVLLISLGSDYNVFVVGRIWEEARRRPVPDAVAIAAPRLAGDHHGGRGPGRQLRHAGGDPAGAVPAARHHHGRRGDHRRDRCPLPAGAGAGGAVRPPGHVAG